MSEKFYTRKELASLLKLSLPSIDKQLKNGEIKHVRIGKCIRIPENEIERLSQCKK
jgi:excisionase family DNA binding protein